MFKYQVWFSLVSSESHLRLLWLMWFCWLHQAMTSSSHWSGLQPSVKWQEWESAPLKVRPWFSAQKGWNALSRLLPQVQEFKHDGLIGAVSTLMRAVHQCVVLKRAPSQVQSTTNTWKNFCFQLWARLVEIGTHPAAHSRWEHAAGQIWEMTYQVRQ